GDLGAFLTGDARGKLLPAYLRELAPALEEEHAAMADELLALGSSVNHIKEIVAIQQSFAGPRRLLEPILIGDLFDDALRMNAGALTRHKVEVVRPAGALPALPLNRNRMLQILVNLISNAKHALGDAASGRARITLDAVLLDGPLLRVTVADNGGGIAPENLTRIFSHGFTTRRNGHGFGLHGSVLAAREVGGSLCVHSDGAGRGATFTLDVPVAAAPARPSAIHDGGAP
ncbi:MAG: histidine kinase, partial [Burkholderiaceae bacterium]|nr:histidine kinase [Burkholderiaceae bacterium]